MFSKCPHCGASILDDTEELCPSCEQPLKGAAKPKAAKASAKPAAKKAAGDQGDPSAQAGKQAASKSAASKQAGAKTPARKQAAPASGEADDDPFDIGGQAGKKALRVHPKPAKGRMHRVECPMCESPGFVPESAAGTEVRCWNKECRLPLFTVPQIEKEPEPEPEPKKKPWAAILLGVILVGGGGAGAYFATRPADDGPTIKPIDPATIANNDDEPAAGPSLVTETVDPNAGKGPVTTAEIVAQAKAAFQRGIDDPGNLARPDSLRLAAEALLQTGTAEEVAQADEWLAEMPARSSFYKIRPLVVRANQALASGDEGSAGDAADQAVELAKTLPPAGREALDWATDLAILLVRLGRVDEAAAIVGQNFDGGIRGEYSALLAGARNAGSFDLANFAGFAVIRNTPNPQWVAVTRGLVSLGRRDLALDWANQATGAVRADSLVAWAGTLKAGESSNVEEISAAASSPVLAARLLAAAGLEAFSRQAETAATEAGEAGAATAASEVDRLLNAAIAKLPTDSPEPMVLPSTRDIHDSARNSRAGLPAFAPVRDAALAYQKIAELQVAKGDRESGWTTLREGLERLRAASPSPVELAELVDEYNVRRTVLRDTLQSQLGLANRTEATKAFNKYRRQVDVMVGAANERFELQERLAGTAIALGLESELLDWMAAAESEPWWSSSIAAKLVQSEDSAISGRAKANAAQRLPRAPISWERIVPELVESGRHIDVAVRLRKLRNDPQTVGLWAGVAASLLVRENRLTDLREFVKNIEGLTTVRSDVVEMAAAQAAKLGHGPEIYEILTAPEARLEPQDLVALYRGVVAGAAQYDEPASETDASPAS